MPASVQLVRRLCEQQSGLPVLVHGISAEVADREPYDLFERDAARVDRLATEKSELSAFEPTREVQVW